jgi:nucleotide-binding universal stress UspA family protein
VLSGTVHDVMQRAAATVGVLVDRDLGWVTNVLVPYLGSAHDQGALRLGQRLALQAGANVTILRVGSPDEAESRSLDIEAPIAEMLEEDSPAGDGKIVLKVVQHASPSRAVLDESARGYDLVVIGVGSEWGLEHRSFGMQSELIIKACPTSLLIVRQYEPALARELPATRRDAPPMRQRGARESS